MDTFKYLKKEGNCYSVKTSGSSLMYFVIIVIGGLGIFSIINGSPIFGGLFILLVLLAVRGMKKKVIFDPESQTITFPAFRKEKSKVLPVNDFRNFKLVKIKQQPIGITTNNQLQMEFEINGKIKALLVRQFGPGSKGAQDLVSEIEQVMKI